jgi:intein/homing endonuclease
MSKGKELLKNLKFYDSYSKYKPELSRKETWSESVNDVMSMHYDKFFDNAEITPYIEFAENMYDKGIVLASQRNLQYRKEQILRANSRLFNCASTYIDRPEVFKQVLYVLLCGCGMGYSVERRFVDKLPKLKERLDETITYQIEDSIEGWANALDMLMMSFFDGSEKIRFDGTLIREEGSFISGGFKAPGYEPLKKSLELIEKMLEDKLSIGDNTITSLDAHEIICISSDAVLSAGVRRSALICLFDKDDELMLNCKTGDWFYKKPWLARANNSVKLVKGQFSEEEFSMIKDKIKEFGEPGLAMVDDIDFTTNPCFTIDQKILTENGWETIEDLLGTNPMIHQDLRIKGRLDENGKEVWDMTGEKGGKTVLTQAYNVSKTGEQQKVYKMTLSCGREVKSTDNHHFATPNGMVELKDLKIGDEILIGVPEVATVDFNSNDFKLGMIAGLCAGDGGLTTETVLLDVWDKGDNEHVLVEEMISEVISNSDYVINRKGGQNIILEPKFNSKLKTDTYEKYRLDSSALRQIFTEEGFISKKESYDWLYKKSKDFKSGFISGFFLADGHVEGWNSKQKGKSNHIVITQNNKEFLKVIQLILQELGIFSKIYNLLPEKMTMLPDGKGGEKEYLTKETFRLKIAGIVQMKRFKNVIKTYGSKKEKIDICIDNSLKTTLPRYKSKISNIYFNSIEDVYCLKEDSRKTLIVNGLVARRCFEIGFIPVNPENGKSCISFCNLTEINGGECNTEQKFYDACKAASISI